MAPYPVACAAIALRYRPERAENERAGGAVSTTMTAEFAGRGGWHIILPLRMRGKMAVMRSPSREGRPRRLLACPPARGLLAQIGQKVYGGRLFADDFLSRKPRRMRAGAPIQCRGFNDIIYLVMSAIWFGSQSNLWHRFVGQS